MEISVYGAAGCPRMAMATEFISAGGGKVRQLDIDANPISSDLIDRVLAFEAGAGLFADKVEEPQPAEDSGTDKTASSEKLRRLLTEKPSALPVPLAVRGSRVVVASDPSRIQSLMY